MSSGGFADESSHIHRQTIHERNHLVFSKMNLPGALLDVVSQTNHQKDRLLALQTTVGQCQETTETILEALDSFTAQVQSMEVVLQPIHEQTEQVLATQRNLEHALKAVYHVLDHYEVVQKATGESPSERLHNDYKAFVNWIFDLHKSLAFWQGKPGVKGVDALTKRLSDTINACIDECEHEFQKILSMQSKQIDIFRLGWPPPNHFEWCPQSTVDRLALLVSAIDSRLDSSSPTITKQPSSSGGGTRSYLVALRTTRLPFLKATMKLFISSYENYINAAKHKTSLKGKSAIKFSESQQRQDGVHHHQQIVMAMLRKQQARLQHGSSSSTDDKRTPNGDIDYDNDDGGADSPFDGSKLGRYKRGKHPVIMYIRVFLGILEYELRLWHDILATSSIEQDELDDAFAMATQGALSSFNKAVDNSLQSATVNRLLITLDILGEIEKLRQRFRDVLKKSVADASDSYMTLIQMKSTLTHSLQDCLLTQIGVSLKDSHSSSKRRKDGSISDTTVETITFLRSLAQYEDVIDSLPVETAYALITKPFSTSTSSSSSSLGSSLGSSGTSSSSSAPMLTVEQVKALNVKLQQEEESRSKQTTRRNKSSKVNASETDMEEVSRAGRGRGGDNDDAEGNSQDDDDPHNNSSIDDEYPSDSRRRRGGVSTGGKDLANRVRNRQSQRQQRSTKRQSSTKTVIPLSILPGLRNASGRCTVSQAVTWDVLQGLDTTLQTRADDQFGKKSVLSYLFLLNNYHYIAQSASNHHFKIHPPFFSLYVEKTQQVKTLYLTHSFTKLLQYLDIDSHDPNLEIQPYSNSFIRTVKKKFEGFNTTFASIYKKHKTYAVPDSDLRALLRSECTDIIVPLYHRFYVRYEGLPFIQKTRGKYVWYEPELLEKLINQFYDELG